MKKTTIKDVAKKAGVAPSTVSFVLNNTENQCISENTRQRVLAASEALGYRPSYMASNMRSNLSKTIGIVAAYNVTRMYFLDMLAGIIEVASKEGYGVMICETGRKDNEEKDYINYYLSNRIDGVLFLSSAHSERDAKEEEYIRSFQRYGIPFVTVYGYTNIHGCNYVNIDFYQCGYEACRHLLQKGCKKIAYIAPLDKDDTGRYEPKTERDKQKGYVDALSRHAEFVSPAAIYLPRNFKKGNYVEIKTVIFNAVNRDGCDGFIACWASYGMQLLSVAAELRLPVSECVKVIALDTVPYLEHTMPGLSSMRLPFYEIAKHAAEILMHNCLREDDSIEPRTVFLPCTVIERESS